jgi:hypothetical protein
MYEMEIGNSYIKVVALIFSIDNAFVKLVQGNVGHARKW